MAQIKEAYVSFETAKLLKEKGFNEDCYTCYVTDEIQHYDYKSRNSDLINGVISAPTQQMAMRWLREIYDLVIYPRLVETSDIEPSWVYTIYNIFSKETEKSTVLYTEPEDAIDAAIKYCLENLI